MLPVKIGEEGQLFESITSQKIAEKLKELGFEVKKTQIDLVEPIKEMGEFPVKIKFEHNLEAEIKLIVTEEKQ
jgi:large subunit ribosomal protein L9